ncbi:hypothetical protein GQX74_010568 [Glossina fuscipes]|nr:hypothetical protein GQX74_010568 [Glossina fuscipes]
MSVNEKKEENVYVVKRATGVITPSILYNDFSNCQAMSILESIYPVMEQLVKLAKYCLNIERLIETTYDHNEREHWVNVLNIHSLILMNNFDDIVSVAISMLPTYKYSSERDDGNEKCCAVCLIDFQLNEIIRKLPCAHDFHADCADKWLKLHQTCPMCRACVFNG